MSSDDDSDDERSPSSSDDDSDEEGEEGERELSTSRLLARRRSTKAREKVLKHASFAKLLQLAKPDSRWILFGILSLLVRLPFSVSMPHFVAMTIGAVVDGNQQKFTKNVQYFLYAGVINGLLDFWNVFLFSFAQTRIVRRLRRDVFRSILRKKIEWFDSRLRHETRRRGSAHGVRARTSARNRGEQATERRAKGGFRLRVPRCEGRRRRRRSSTM